MRTPQVAPLARFAPLGLKSAPRVSFYSNEIRQRLAATGHVGKYDPRHVEAYMRLEHGTLDGLSARQFDDEVETSRQCIDAGGTADAEALALSYGL